MSEDGEFYRHKLTGASVRLIARGMLKNGADHDRPVVTFYDIGADEIWTMMDHEFDYDFDHIRLEKKA
jgi:hypothetical protein